MPDELNPYRPGNGLEPPYLAGRAAELQAMTGFLDGFSGFPRNVALYGLRGVGKTCLLREYRRLALERNWVTVRRELSPRVTDETTFAITLLSDLQNALEDLSTVATVKAAVSKALTNAREFVGELRLRYQELEFGLSQGDRGQRTGLLDDDSRRALERVGEAARARGRGVLISYDEFQELRDTKAKGAYPLGAFVGALASVQQEGLPVMLVACGLPPLIEHLGEAQSYTERMFEGQEIGALAVDQARAALEQPLRGSGRQVTPKAVAQVVELTGSYPYFVQHYGRELWEATTGSVVVVVVVVAALRDAEDAIRGKLDDYFFRARFVRATQAERGVMALIAGSGEQATIQQLLEASGRKNNSLQMVVRGLVTKGLVYRPTRGEVAFSAPMFGDYVRRKGHAT